MPNKLIVPSTVISTLGKLDLDLLDDQIHHLHELEDKHVGDEDGYAIAGTLNFLSELYRLLADANNHQSKHLEPHEDRSKNDNS